MQVGKISFIALASVALVALAGCPKSSPEGGETPQTKGPKISSTPSLKPGEQVVEGKSESGEAATADNLDKDELAAIPEAGEIKGQWFALYGSGFSGPVRFDYATGHVIDFRDDGKADWMIRNNGTTLTSIPTSYKVEGASLILNFASDSLGENHNYSSATPLGFGRDKEIGLSAGRDQEVGLSGGRDKEVGLRAEKPGSNETELKLALLSDGRFLALTDAYNHLMVYGRVQNPGTKLSSTMGGAWQGHMKQHESFAANFTVSGTEVSATLDGDRGTFSGVLTQGYVVGEISGPQGKELAAILPEAQNVLNGVYTPEPYNELRLQFDFDRMPAQS